MRIRTFGALLRASLFCRLLTTLLKSKHNNLIVFLHFFFSVSARFCGHVLYFNFLYTTTSFVINNFLLHSAENSPTPSAPETLSRTSPLSRASVLCTKTSQRLIRAPLVNFLPLFISSDSDSDSVWFYLTLFTNEVILLHTYCVLSPCISLNLVVILSLSLFLPPFPGVPTLNYYSNTGCMGTITMSVTYPSPTCYQVNI